MRLEHYKEFTYFKGIIREQLHKVKPVEEALANLQETTEFCLEKFPLHS